MIRTKIIRVLPSKVEEINKELNRGTILNSYMDKDEKGRLYIVFKQLCKSE